MRGMQRIRATLGLVLLALVTVLPYLLGLMLGVLISLMLLVASASIEGYTRGRG